MHNFDLRKFLIENRPTTVSKDRLDEFEFRTVDRSNIGNFTDKDSEDFMTGAGEEQDQVGVTSLANPVLNAKVASLVSTVRQNPNAFGSVKQEIVKRINRLEIDIKDRKQLLYQVQGITHPAVLQKWYNNNVLQESNIMNNFDLKKFLVENKLTKASRTLLKESQHPQEIETEGGLLGLFIGEVNGTPIYSVEDSSIRDTMVYVVGEEIVAIEVDGEMVPGAIIYAEYGQTEEVSEFLAQDIADELGVKYQSYPYGDINLSGDGIDQNLMENKKTKKQNNMSFNLRKFLTENKLTQTSKAITEVSDPGFDQFMDAVDDLYMDHPRYEELQNAVENALHSGQIDSRPYEPGSYTKQVVQIAKEMGIEDSDQYNVVPNKTGFEGTRDDLMEYKKSKKQNNMSFNLRKFLTENKLTSASKLTKENTLKGTVLEEVRFQDDTEQENLVFTLYTVADPTADIGNLKGVIPNKAGQRTMISITDTGEEFDVTSIGTLEYIVFTGEEEGYWREGTSEDTHDCVINRQDIDGEDPMPKIENWLMRQQHPHKTGFEGTRDDLMEEEVMDDTGHNNEGVSRYLSLESAEEVIKELEKDVNKATMEAKLSKMKEVIEAIEAKADSLEEDAGLKGFISPKKLSEMRKMTKKLRVMQERYVKEYDKKFKSTKTKMNEGTSLIETSIRKLVREALGRK